MAVEIIAEKYRGTHPKAPAGEVYSAVIAAIVGQGEYADLWSVLRDRTPRSAPAREAAFDGLDV
jgi:hypothetical protein